MTAPTRRQPGSSPRRPRGGGGGGGGGGPTSPPPIVEWRDGVHLAGTPLWCDARQAREVCFLSSARVLAARRHRQILATAATIRLLPETAGQRRAAEPSRLAVPYGRPFALGTLRLELFPSGHAVGSASLLVEGPRGRVVYAGAVGPGGALVPAAEARPCEALILDATFAHARFRFPPGDEVAAEIAAWVRRALAEGATPVLLADPLGRAADLARLVGGTRDAARPDAAAPASADPAAPLPADPVLAPLCGHRSIVEALRRLRALGVPLPRVRQLQEGAPPAPGEAVLWPIAAWDPRALPSPGRARVALVSGWALDPAYVARLGAHAAFPWSDRLGRAELLAYVEQSGARDVYLLGGTGDIPGRPLGQLRLF